MDEEKKPARSEEEHLANKSKLYQMMKEIRSEEHVKKDKEFIKVCICIVVSPISACDMTIS